MMYRAYYRKVSRAAPGEVSEYSKLESFSQAVTLERAESVIRRRVSAINLENRDDVISLVRVERGGFVDGDWVVLDTGHSWEPFDGRTRLRFTASQYRCAVCGITGKRPDRMATIVRDLKYRDQWDCRPESDRDNSAKVHTISAQDSASPSAGLVGGAA